MRHFYKYRPIPTNFLESGQIFRSQCDKFTNKYDFFTNGV